MKCVNDENRQVSMLFFVVVCCGLLKMQISQGQQFDLAIRRCWVKTSLFLKFLANVLVFANNNIISIFTHPAVLKCICC